MKEDYQPLLDDGERLSLPELRELQLTRLRETIELVYENVEIYKRKFDDLGCHPRDLETLDDLRKFPFTLKADLKDAYPFGLFAQPIENISRLHASSGTTGKATVVGYTRDDINTWSDVVARSIRAAGGRPGMKVHIAYGYGLFTGGLGAHYGAEKLGCTVIPVSAGQTERQVQLIIDFEPDIIMVTPSYMLTLLDEFHRQGIDPRSSSLKIGIFGAEPWSVELRDELEAAFDIDAVDIYGLSEIIGPGVANECVETKDGLTLWEDHFYPEIIDPVTLEPLPDGEFGELVLTSLTKKGMPIIRYRTRDLTRLLSGTARPMRRMDRISGRNDDMIILRGVNLFPTQIEEIIGQIPGLSFQYYIRLTQEDRKDVMTVFIEGLVNSNESENKVAANELKRLIKARIGVSVSVKVVTHGEITRSEGKAKRIYDLR